MRFEDTGFTDSPMMRRAFLVTSMDALGRIIVTDDGKRLPSTMDLQLRAANILKQTIPGAGDEQVAGALMFLTRSFNRSGAVLMQRAGDDKLMPQVYAWSQEWHEIQRGGKPLGNASRALRQILTAVSAAQMEDYKKNFAAADPAGLRQVLAEQDLMASRMGDIDAPQLEGFAKALRGQLTRLQNGLPAEDPAAAAPTTVLQKSVKTNKPFTFKP